MINIIPYFLIVIMFFFPYVDQLGDDAKYNDDCGSAAIQMVVKYHDIEIDETVDETHFDLVGGDYPVTFILVADYLETRFGLDTKIVVTYSGIKYALENAGFDVSEIEVIEMEDFPDDVPVIWVYSYSAHWVVRFQGWNFDPYNGIFRFDQTNEIRGIKSPELGLGIIVTEDEP